MASESANSWRYQFGVFELNPSSGELLKHGTRIKLQDQPTRVLTVLLEHAGEIVTREQLREKLWGHDTFVDYDHSLNISINKLREVLSDSAASPRYIETVPKRGYRFIAPVRTAAAEGTSAQPAATFPSSPMVAARESSSPPDATLPTKSSSRSRYLIATAGLILLAILAMTFRQLARRPAPSERVMLAVLPFENLSPDEQEAFFVTGLHDELIAELGRLHPSRLGVIARTSVLQYARAPKPVREIGRDLQVNYVLEGSVRPIGDHFRITAELIKVADQTQMWIETYEPTMGDMLAMQEDVARRVSQAIAVEFLPEARQALHMSTTSNAAAYEAYLRGRFFWYQLTRPSIEAAITQFEKAIELDPQYAPAYAGLSDAYGVLGGYGFVPAEQVFPKSKDAALKALAIDPNSSNAYNSLAYISFYYDWDWEGAERQFRKAIQLNSNNQDAHEFLSAYLHAMGRLDEAKAENQVAIQLDPLNAWLYDDNGWLLLTKRRPEQASQVFRKAIELNPNYTAAHLSLAVSYIRMGRFTEALAETQKAEALSADPTRVLEIRGSVQALSGDRAGAEATLQRLLKSEIGGRVSPYSVALIYTALGDKPHALDWLERCYQEKDTWVVWTGILVEWDSLRGEPRFIDLQHKLKMPVSVRNRG
jgi:TolB-like protein/DNA-binding winged helix-turn-helix (wHTH) protein/Tfp pilus assembly protein PilF